MPEYVTGKAVFYGPYAMDATANYRGISYEEEGCLGGISLMSPYNIWDKAWVQIDEKWYGPYCVVDCARRGDMYPIVVYREEVIEINFELAVEVGMVSEHDVYGNYEVYEWYKDVEVLVNISPHEYSFNENPIVYKEYFLENIEFAEIREPSVILIEKNKWKEYNNEKYWVKETENKINSDKLPLDKFEIMWYNETNIH
jgi:hypothetical protein